MSVPVNINGINELDLNLAGTVTASVTDGKATINQTVPAVPVTIAPVANTYLTGYNATLGTFSTAPAVASFNTRTGAVVPATGDYTAAQVTHALDLSSTATQTMSGNLIIPVGMSIGTPILRDVSGNAVATFSGGVATFRQVNIFPGEANTAVQTTVNTTSGTVIFSQPQQGSSWKKVIIYLNASTGAASYTFPAAFTHTPAIVTTNGPAAAIVTALSTSAVTVTGSTTTGFIILEGF